MVANDRYLIGLDAHLYVPFVVWMPSWCVVAVCVSVCVVNGRILFWFIFHGVVPTNNLLCALCYVHVALFGV